MRRGKGIYLFYFIYQILLLFLPKSGGAIFPCTPGSGGSDIQSNFPIQYLYASTAFLDLTGFALALVLWVPGIYGCLASALCFGTSSVAITYFEPLNNKFRDGGRSHNQGGPISNLVGRIYPAWFIGLNDQPQSVRRGVHPPVPPSLRIGTPRAPFHGTVSTHDFRFLT